MTEPLKKIYALAIRDPRYGSRDWKNFMFNTDAERREYLEHRLEDNPTVEYALTEWDKDWPDAQEEEFEEHA